MSRGAVEEPMRVDRGQRVAAAGRVRPDVPSAVDQARGRRGERRAEMRGCSASRSGPSRSGGHPGGAAGPRTAYSSAASTRRRRPRRCPRPAARLEDEADAAAARSRRACRRWATASWPSPARRRSTTRGSAADRPARKKRLTPVTRQRGEVEQPVRHVQQDQPGRAAGPGRRAAGCRTAAPAAAASGRAARPANGPSSEYGSSSTAIADGDAAGARSASPGRRRRRRRARPGRRRRRAGTAGAPRAVAGSPEPQQHAQIAGRQPWAQPHTTHEAPGARPGASTPIGVTVAGTRVIAFSGTAVQRSTSPRMNFSTLSRAWSSKYCTGGDFMKYEDADRIGPPMPRSLAIFAAAHARR